MIRTQVLKHLPGAKEVKRSQEQERAREEGAKEMSEKERLPEEQCRRVGMSGSLRGGG